MKKSPDSKSTPSNDTATAEGRYSRSRRRLLQSLAAGGAAVTVKALPEYWAKPVLDTTHLPAHAMTTLPADFALSCEVGNVDSGVSININYDDPLRGNGASGIVWLTDPGDLEAGSVGFDVDNIHAWTDPISVPITLTITEASNATIDTSNIDLGTQHGGAANNTLDFGGLEVQMTDGGSNQGTVDFTFSAGGQSCSIDIVFSEYPLGVGP